MPGEVTGRLVGGENGNMRVARHCDGHLIRGEVNGCLGGETRHDVPRGKIDDVLTVGACVFEGIVERGLLNFHRLLTLVAQVRNAPPEA